jgi:putative ABC transport system permease protein
MIALRFSEDCLRNARQALRMIGRNPGFGAAAILSLGIGIGAITAIFSLVNAVLIHPLPYSQPESLVGVFNSAVIQGETFKDMQLAPAMYVALKERCAAFQEFGVWSLGAATVTGVGDPEQVKTVKMTQGVLPALGIQPFLGRRLSVEDDTPGTPETVILTYSYWSRRFGRDPHVLGREVVIDSVPHQVIGVMSPTFWFLDYSPDIILAQRFATANPAFDPFDYSGIARLKLGVTITVANQEVASILNGIIPENIRPFVEQAQMKPNLRPLKRDVIGDIGPALVALMGSVSLVFLLVCANVANLVLVRAQARTQELAIRAALGAGWSRIALDLLIESLTLGLLGGATGIGLAYGAEQILKAQDLTTIPRLATVSVDTTTLAFALGCSVSGSMLFGLIAVLKYGVTANIVHARGASMGIKQARAQTILVIAQIALSLILLIESGLLLRSFVVLLGVHPGFTHAEQIQTVRIAMPETEIQQAERVARMQAEIVEMVSHIPGVEAAGFADGLPMESEYHNGMIVAIENKFVPGQTPPNRDLKHISPRLFAALGTRLLAGRDFTWDDMFNHRLVAIVSDNMARENWGEPNAALGRRLRLGALNAPWFDVVGVVEDVHDDGLNKPAPPTVYLRAGVYDSTEPGQPPAIRRSVTLAIRSRRAGTEGFLREISSAIHSVNPNLPLAQVRTLETVYRRSTARTSFTLIVLGIAGALALVLSIIGIYGVLAYAVGHRRRELAIRVALGAQSNHVRMIFLRRGMLMAGIGAAMGVAGAMSLSHLVSSLLFGVKALDAATYAVSTLTVVTAALLASYVPACRATSVEVVKLLRAD